MRIGIDLRCLEEEKISGVGEYALELVRNLLEIDEKNEYVIFSNSYKQKSRNFNFFEKYPNAKLKRSRWPNKLLNFFLWYFGWPKLDRLIEGTDIFFAPNINFLAVSSPRTKSTPNIVCIRKLSNKFQNNDLVRGKNCELITTFHDLSFERFPEFFTRKTCLWHYYFVNPRRIAQKSERIIAVSESTKKDLKEIYKINSGKIGVVYHGVSGDFRIIDRNDPKLLEAQKKYKLPYKFILYLGNIEPRKNITSVIKAYKNLLRNNPKLEKYKLVLAGNINPLCRDIMDKKKENIAICGYIKREDRPYIFNLASLFVYPSHFEGFGLPVLETMACGTPVIASNNSSLSEVVGNTAILVSPHRPDEIAEAMEAILTDEKLRSKLKEKGLKQAQKFNWKKCAASTLKIIEEIHENRH